jgi:hypothetical protein
VIEVEKKVSKWLGKTVYVKKGTNILHREDGPAVIWNDGDEVWYFEGNVHREGGPAKIMKAYEAWYKHGELHRVDGPALILPDGSKEWFFNGERHREDGPAMLSSCGTMTWCLGDIFFNTKEKWFEALPENKKVAALYSEYIVGG